MKRVFSFIIFCLLITFSVSCKKKESNHSEENVAGSTTSAPTPSPTTYTVSFNGSVQKGPFSNGSTVNVFELNGALAQTGKSFNSQISDNAGSFQFNNLQLVNPVVAITANGFYYNEVCGGLSGAQISLNCVANVSGTNTIHVNVLTHLEKPRIEYLVTAGLNGDSAKRVAQKEVLAIFNTTLTNNINSEFMDIGKTGDENSALLAISAIIQGFRTESELMVFLGNMCNDIKTDGVLNDNTIQSSLIDHARLLDTVSIRNNLNAYYAAQGITATVPYFEKHIRNFVNNTTFTVTNSVQTFPQNGVYGPNLLVRNQTTFSGTQFALAGQIKKCSKFKVRIHRISGTLWGYVNSSNQNLSVTVYNGTNDEQFFTVVNSTLPFDVYLTFSISPGGGTYLLEYYENDMNIPSFSKTITIS